MAWTDYYPYAALGGGVLSDILGAISRSQAARQQQSAYRSQLGLYRLLADPNQLAQYIARIYQPMSEAERRATSRSLMADRAMRGETSGGAVDQFIANAFAEREGQRYNDAASIALRALTGAPYLPGATPGATLRGGQSARRHRQCAAAAGDPAGHAESRQWE